jgi:hypothetical protein
MQLLGDLLDGHPGVGQENDAGAISQALFACSFARPPPQDGFLIGAELYSGRCAGHTRLCPLTSIYASRY